ncbi:flagellar biosynthetic protein FliR [Roseobacter sp. HKCCA0434]|uniref:flagellar biosynthetic protein FliR n=1 Tax=Roseobacter sp. HKCCA0434 TaxID=3079297 RepID=UPI002905833B|nr:flagellar biosynthetic protein FliR [Roseobacter sp. HKCCA0434]
MTELLEQVLSAVLPNLQGIILLFCRVAAAVLLMPGFGSTLLPARVRLVVAIGFTLAVWPLVETGRHVDLLPGLFVEIAVGVVLGLSVRFLVFALQFAGSIASQSTSIAQIGNAAAMPDPMPALGSILTLAGITLALALGLHVRIVEAIVLSYDAVPVGRFPPSDELARWAIRRSADAIAMGVTLAAPFIVTALAYNLALGAINRAMPQLMVAFVGAPAITGAALLLMLVSAPAILTLWTGAIGGVLADPFGAMP